MICYNVHNLVEVRVDPRTAPPILASLEFQIGHFRADAQPTSTAASAITVAPFEARTVPQAALSHFHHYRCLAGRYVEDAANHLAIERTDTGFAVFADEPNFLINMFIQLLLVPRGVALVHAAAVAAPDDDHVTLLPGAGGVGKTAILGTLVMDHRYRLLGDDLVAITRDGRCLSFPRQFVIKPYHRWVYPQVFDRLGLKHVTIEASNRGPGPLRALANLIADNAPLRPLIKAALARLGLLEGARTALAGPRTPRVLAAVSVNEIFGEGSTLAEGPIGKVLFMERTSATQFTVERLAPSALRNRVVSIIAHEWVDFDRQLCTLGAMELIDLAGYQAGLESIVGAALAGQQPELLAIPEKADPRELVEQFLAQRQARAAPLPLAA